MSRVKKKKNVGRNEISVDENGCSDYGTLRISPWLDENPVFPM